MKVLVTGVNGQLGYDVMNELNQRGHEAIGSDITESNEHFQKYVQLFCPMFIRMFRKRKKFLASGIFLLFSVTDSFKYVRIKH